MVNFEIYLNNVKDKEWSDYYVNYGRLKNVLREAVKRRALAKQAGAIGVKDEESFQETMILADEDKFFAAGVSDDDFSKNLDKEIEKVVIFFLKIQGQIASRLLHLRSRMRALGPLDISTSSSSKTKVSREGVAPDDSLSSSIRAMDVKGSSSYPTDLVEDYRDICEKVCKLLRFIELNAEAVRKILKKHDRHLIADDMITRNYLTTRASRNPYGHLRQLFSHNGINAIISSLKVAIEEMPGICRRLPNSIDGLDVEEDDKEAVKGMILALDQVQRARAQVQHKTNPFLSFLSLKPLIFDQEELEPSIHHAILSLDLTLPHTLSIYLNIAQIFLSTVNAYITVPTTQAYAEDLGVNAAYSGIIIGMSPLAQILSAFFFSYWSNFAFKLPLIISCLLQLFGNVLYGAALGYKSLTMLLVGRFLGGAGTAEAVNRRFIADVIPVKERTAASVAFVTASALGMSTGPALAAALFPIDFRIGRFPITDSTAPAWLMVILWALFIIVMCVYFREPTTRLGHRKRYPIPSQKKGGEPLNEQSPLLPTPSTYGTPNEALPASIPFKTEKSTGSEQDYPDSLPSMLDTGAGGSHVSFVGLSRVYSKSSKKFLEKVVRHPLAKLHPILVMVWRNKPLIITLAVYFLIEIADEIILSSAGLIASSYFDWGIEKVGAFLAVLGLMVLPANYLVEQFSGHGYEDRTIIVTSQAITIIGLLCIISYWGSYSEFQFLVGTSVIFVSVAVMEGVDTSLMSKVIPPVLSRGTFNSGLLAVQIGTVAKALGDGMITLIGLSARDLINGLYVPILIITIGLMLICMRYFADMS